MKRSPLILKLKCPGAPLKRRKMNFIPKTPISNKILKCPDILKKRKIYRMYGDLSSIKKKLVF